MYVDTCPDPSHRLAALLARRGATVPSALPRGVDGTRMLVPMDDEIPPEITACEGCAVLTPEEWTAAQSALPWHDPTAHEEPDDAAHDD